MIDVDGAVLAVAAPTVDGTFRANVCVTIAHIDGDYSLDRAAAAAKKKFARLPEFAPVGQEPIDVLDRPGYRLEGTYRDPRAGVLFQAARFTTVRVGSDTEVVEVVGTCAGEHALLVVPVLRDILASAREAAPAA